MIGFGAISAMNQMIKNNLDLLKKRNRLKDNPFLPAGPEAELRNTTNYDELMAHRFARKEYAQRLSFWTRVFIAAVIVLAIVFYYF
jgi:hypothetical protein